MGGRIIDALRRDVALDSNMNALTLPRRFVGRYTILLLVASTSTLSVGADVTRQHAPEVQALMEWFEQHSTVFNRKQQVRREVPSDPNSAIGVFAAEDISEGEVLFALPWNAIINDQRPAGADDGSETSDEGAIECNTVRNLIDEMKKGSDSKFAPYIKYLMQQRPGQLPSAWTKEGKLFLFEVLGGTNALPPRHPYHWISDDWHKGCNGGSDPLEENAAMLVVQRAEDDLMIPLYDMYNHRNGKYHNTINHRIEGKEFRMKASRNIEQGEQIYNSYNLCSGCEGRKGAYGSAGMFSFYSVLICLYATCNIYFSIFHCRSITLTNEFTSFSIRDISRLWIYRRVSSTMDIPASELCFSGGGSGWQ